MQENNSKPATKYLQMMMTIKQKIMPNPKRPADYLYVAFSSEMLSYILLYAASVFGSICNDYKMDPKSMLRLQSNWRWMQVCGNYLLVTFRQIEAVDIITPEGHDPEFVHIKILKNERIFILRLVLTIASNFNKLKKRSPNGTKCYST